jgi:aldose 1-epimerase
METKLAVVEAFGALNGGEAVECITLRNGALTARLLTLGATLQGLTVPDRVGEPADIVLGWGHPQAYLDHPVYLGSVVGRYANRIAGGRFVLDGVAHQVDVNNGPNSLHGGAGGFHQRIWAVEALGIDPVPHVRFCLESPHGDQGFPGQLRASATYRLHADGLELLLEAACDAPTIVNLTGHAYFNLAGHAAGRDIADHHLHIAADAFLPVDATAIPTGPAQPVAGGWFDFTQPRRVGEGLEGVDDLQLALGHGYDHDFVLRAGRQVEPAFAARLIEPESGRVMEVWTSEPGLQFYTGNFLPDGLRGKDGAVYGRRGALCLEPQAHPDTPNRADFPPCRLNPGQTYHHRIFYRFSTDAGA